MRKRQRFPALLVVTCLVLFSGRASRLPGQSVNDKKIVLAKKTVPYVPTPQIVVDRMLEAAQVKKGDVVYDLGSGDGRIVITAARRYGVQAVGFEIDPKLVEQSRKRIRDEGLEGLAQIRPQDIFTADLTPATVVTLYLLPRVNRRLRPRLLKQLRPGSRVVSHEFDMGDWNPVRVEQVKDSTGTDHPIYLWRIEGRAPRPGP